MAFSQRSKNTHLAVIHLTLTTTPLALNTDRMFALLGKTTLIDQQTAIRCPTQPLIRFLSHLIQDRTMVPVGFAQHMLKTLVIGINDCLFHPFHILFLRLHQTIEIVGCRLKY